MTPKHHRRGWRDADHATLRRLYPDTPTRDVAAIMGRRIGAVYQKAMALGLKKSPAYLASDAAARIQRGNQHPAMIASRFQPGDLPWNTGKSYQPGGRCAETQFRKGNQPHNTNPVGAYRLNKGGHLQQKIGNAPGNNSQRWRTVAELVWCAAHGPLPAGHIVVFRPGQFTAVLEQITLERVECISKAENARRNHPRSKSPELARLVQLKGAITRQVNRIYREHKERATQPEAPAS